MRARLRVRNSSASRRRTAAPRNCRRRCGSGSSAERRHRHCPPLRRRAAGGRRLRHRRERRDHEPVRAGLRRRRLHLHRKRQPRHEHRAWLSAARAHRLDDAGRGFSRVRLAVRAAPVAADAERRGRRRGRGPDARRPGHLGLRDRRSGLDDGGGLSGSRGAHQRRHPRARMADAGSRDITVRNARCREGGRRILPVSRRQPEDDRRARQQRGRLHPDPALSRNGHRGSRAAARRPHAAEEPAQPRDERIHRFRHRDGCGQFLGRRPQPQFFAGIRPARPQQHEPDEPHLSRRGGQFRAGAACASAGGDARTGVAPQALQRHAFLRPGLFRTGDLATRGSTRSRRRSPRA